ncbi:2OG-Fe(II) oxygenase [Thermocoleostomius sinensis]|jgi:Rps23 Pro-64 3,4-dihydroxylase Tpa1-like proline 4-hydroxylase|uniref:2OG-Fe(II) oxygenase n=1 Tax=Thermocoleostomius sinensis A174 TaxID=2016057 RepID=A0A9E8ZB02_9CYAN|nr:2OG-Fe(II) oxygenase [Thermocoleostomius sinensis]WAL58088.1 2OG-Fe(II) oxygenase [Thermocoleostomius sinensis A174]
MKDEEWLTQNLVIERTKDTMQPDRSTPDRPAEPTEVELTLLLSGGQSYTLSIAPHNPLLQQLFAVLMETPQRSQRLFQIPIKQGQAVLAFPSDRLVGIVTEPPIVIQSPPKSAAVAQKNPIGVLSADPLVSQYIQFENFLTPEEHQRLLNYTIQHKAEFVSTQTSTKAANYRESLVLYVFPEFANLISQRVQQVFPELVSKLGLKPFQISQIEAQLTAHNHGNFYKIHNDNGSQETATRELTYVYYFYREPKAFSGGELVIYDSKVENNFYVRADTSKIVQPLNNSIVFFLSRYLHEVLPVDCPSQQFADSRFTINGWIRRS